MDSSHSDSAVIKTGIWLIHPDDRGRSIEEMRNLQAGRPSAHFENRILCKDGSCRWMSWRSMVDRSSVYAIARDITEIKQAQEQLDVLRSSLAQTSRQTTIGAMAASIAHEMRQPLSGISASAGAASRWLKASQPDLVEVEAALERIVRDTRRVDDVITGVRSMFSNKSGEKSSVDVTSLIGEAIALTQNELQEHQAAFQNNTPKNLPSIFANRVQLRQVLVNLILNGIDAMNVVDRERILTVDVELDDNAMTIAISDMGEGVPQEQLDRIFEPFFTTKPEGMGLGLFICRSIVEAHNGKLWASPRLPFGTTFHISLSVGHPAPN
jgi:C4-dicarboxylate-specific signal transduction histidine kinase